MRIALIISVLLSISTVSAQEEANKFTDTCQYLLNSSHWSFTKFSYTCGAPLHEIRIIGDTIVDQHLCSILGVFNGGAFVDSSELIIYNTGSIISFYEDSIFKRLYKFDDLMVDSINTYYLPKNFKFYDISSTSGLFIPKNKIYRYKIKGIFEVAAEDGSRIKVYETEVVVADSLVFEDGFYFGEILEGIGSRLGFLGQGSSQLTIGCGPFFRCYNDDELSYKAFEGDCLLANTVEIETEIVRIYPNPVGQYLFLEGSEEYATYQIFDLAGRQKLSGNLQFRLQVDSLDDGIYILKLLSENNKSKSIKFLKG